MKVVLVFCEGRHDVTFAQRSLSAHSNCKLVEESIHKLPAPLGRGENGQSKTIKKGLIAGTFERSFPEDLPKDLPLRAAGHSPVPCFQAIVKNTATDTMFFMARTEGKDQNKPVLEFLNNLDLTIRSGGDIDVTQYAAAFLFDANGAGVCPDWMTSVGDIANTLVISRISSIASGCPQAPYLSSLSAVSCFTPALRSRQAQSRIIWHRWRSGPGLIGMLQLRT